MNFAKRIAFLLLKEISSALGVFATSLLTPLSDVDAFRSINWWVTAGAGGTLPAHN
jgi:hypothetical protein